MSRESSVPRRKLASSLEGGGGVEGGQDSFLDGIISKQDVHDTPQNLKQQPKSSSIGNSKKEEEAWSSAKAKSEPSSVVPGTVCSALAEVSGFCSDSPVPDFRPSFKSSFKDVDPTKVFPSAAKPGASGKAGPFLGVQGHRQTNQFLSPLVRTNLFGKASAHPSKFTVSPRTAFGPASGFAQTKKGSKTNAFKPIAPAASTQEAQTPNAASFQRGPPITVPRAIREAQQGDFLLETQQNHRQQCQTSVMPYHKPYNHRPTQQTFAGQALGAPPVAVPLSLHFVAPALPRPIVMEPANVNVVPNPNHSLFASADDMNSPFERKPPAVAVVVRPQQRSGGKNERTQLHGPPPRRFSRWSLKEDEILVHAVNSDGGPPINWKSISQKYFHGRRNENQCKGRWKKHLRPDINRTAWTKEEDDLLVKYQQEGLTWTEIASKLNGRSSDQVRERFTNHADPSLNRAPFTDEERQILYEEQRKIGNKWTEIAKLLPGRSENQVKNCWHNAKMSQRRKLGRLANVTLQPKKRRKKNGDEKVVESGNEKLSEPDEKRQEGSSALPPKKRHKKKAAKDNLSNLEARDDGHSSREELSSKRSDVVQSAEV